MKIIARELLFSPAVPRRPSVGVRGGAIIMVTALVSNDETGQDASVYQGGLIMVPKPIRFDKLLEVIESQLAKA
jgi:hypothetical protein